MGRKSAPEFPLYIEAVQNPMGTREKYHYLLDSSDSINGILHSILSSSLCKGY